MRHCPPGGRFASRLKIPPQPVATVARVSLPSPPEDLPRSRQHGCSLGASRCLRRRVITRHPDGAPRRVMPQLPREPGRGELVEGLYGSGDPQAAPEEKAPGIIVTDRWQVVPLGSTASSCAGRDGTLLAAIEPFGPVKPEGEGLHPGD